MIVALLACTADATRVEAPVLPVMPGVEAQSDSAAFVSAERAEGSPHACPQPLLSPSTGGWLDSAASAHEATSSPGDPPVRVHLLLGADASREVTFVWDTGTGSLASVVEVSVGDGPAWTLTGGSYEVGSRRVHVVRGCGFAAGRSWTYRVGGSDAWSEPATFVTAPPPGADEPVRAVVLGDSRGAPDTMAALLAAATAQGAEFVVFTGDAVNTGSNWTEWEAWFDGAPEAFASLPMVFGFGNHEGNAQYSFALFPTATDSANFGVDYGPLHFSVVNDTLESGRTWADVAALLEADLAASSAPFRVPVWHRPAVSSCNPHGEDVNTRTYLLPVVEEAGVELVLTGHNHNYERSHPWRYGARDDLRGTVHVVAGGAGAPIYTGTYGRDYTAVEAKVEHFLLLEADAHELRGVAYDLAGNLVDDFTLRR